MTKSKKKMLNRRIKQTVGSMMALALVTTGMPVGFANINEGTSVRLAYADDSLTYTVGNSVYSYTILNDGTVEITDYSGTDTEIKIPEVIEGKKVTIIGYSAFEGCRSLTKIEIPESVTSIGGDAFTWCSNLTEVEIPESVESIGWGAFEECSSLTKVEIPNSVTNIGFDTFRGCISLTEVEIPEDVTYIGSSAFYGCSSLKRIEIPEGVTTIEKYTFAKCNSLEEVILSEKLEKIGYNAFSYAGIESISIPESVTTIEGYAFYKCDKLKSIYIPENVKEMGYGYSSGLPTMGMFAGCYNLKTIDVSQENKYYKSYNNSIYTADGKELIEYSPSETELSLLEGVESIGNEAFFLARVRNITLPDSVKNICWRAFAYCGDLKVEIPSSVTDIGDRVFQGCEKTTIYGQKGSYAETYAEENSIPFIAIGELTSADDIVVEYSIDSESSDIDLKTKLLTESDEEYKNIILTDKVSDSSVSPDEVKFTAYDISLVDENNNKVQPKEAVKVKIPCPNEYDGTKCKVYRVNDNGDLTDMNAEYKDGYMVFETDHFSTYIITETELITPSDVILGDGNGDGIADIKDSALLKRYLAGWEVDIDLTAADMDGDGNVTIKDSALLKRQLAGW